MIKHRVEFEGDVFSALFTWVAGGADPVSPSIEGFVERHVAQFVPASAHRLLAQPAGTPADCGSMETTLNPFQPGDHAGWCVRRGGPGK